MAGVLRVLAYIDGICADYWYNNITYYKFNKFIKFIKF
jgi:hypothetical protein